MTVHPSRLKISSISGSIDEFDGVGELNPDTLTTRSLRKYQEPSVSHRIGDGNDFTDRVVNRRNSYLFVIRVRDHISKIHVVENDGLNLNRTVMEVMVGFRYLHGFIHSNVPLVSKPWISMEWCTACLSLPLIGGWCALCPLAKGAKD